MTPEQLVRAMVAHEDDESAHRDRYEFLSNRALGSAPADICGPNASWRRPRAAYAFWWPKTVSR